MSVCVAPDCSQHKMPDAVFVRPKQARLLQRGPARIVTLTLREMEGIVLQLSNCKNKTEFEEMRTKRFGDYMNLSFILANAFSMPDSKPVKSTAIQRSLRNVERVIEHFGKPQMGPEVIQECIFNIETLGRAYRLVGLITERGEVSSGKKGEDQELASRFSAAAIWSQLHLDCLRYAITHEIVVPKDVLSEFIEGLRLSVMAYSYARQGIELRTVREPYLTDIMLDDEDRELLNESFIDCESSLENEPS
jgi:hypothetical protein